MSVVVLPAVEELAEHLARALEAEEVILFGSRARGEAREDSDADFLVITARAVGASEVQRVVGEFRSKRPDTPLPQVTVHSLDELRATVRAGSVTMREALREGLVMAGVASDGTRGQSRHAAIAKEWSRLGAVATWLAKASDDLAAGQLCLAGGYRWVAAFHAQQSAEKALKALIVHRGDDPERTHELGRLLSHVRRLDRRIGAELMSQFGAALEEMSPYGVRLRYPSEDVSEPEARLAVETAESVLEEVRRATTGGGPRG